MNTVPLFLEPTVFFTLVGLLFCGAAAAIFLSGWQSKKVRSAFHDAAERDRLRITELEAIVVAKDEEFSKVDKLLAAKDELLSKEVVQYNEALARIKGLEEDSAALKKELALKNQMYEGLKGQYAELEKSFEQSMQNIPALKPAVKDEQPPMYVIETSPQSETKRPEAPAVGEDKLQQTQSQDLDKLINFIKEE